MCKKIIVFITCLFVFSGCARSEIPDKTREADETFLENFSEEQGEKESTPDFLQEETASEESSSDISKIPIDEEPYIIKWSEVSAKEREENTYILSLEDGSNWVYWKYRWKPIRFIKNGMLIEYCYNKDGNRSAKYINEKLVAQYEYEYASLYDTYYLHKEIRSEYEVEYLWEVTEFVRGNLTGFRYQDKIYTYVYEHERIVGVTDQEGNILVEYRYSGRSGQEVSIVNVTDEMIAKVNSMVLNGVVYDEETDYYYDNSQGYQQSEWALPVSPKIEDDDEVICYPNRKAMPMQKAG